MAAPLCKRVQHSCTLGILLLPLIFLTALGGTASVLHMWLPPQVRFQSDGSLLPTDYFIAAGPL
jgi:hypothetical protein